MKTTKPFVLLLSIFIIASCGPDESKLKEKITQLQTRSALPIMPVDKGFSEYISGFTSGMIPANAVIEVRFTPEFAAAAKKETPAGLFQFEPQIRGNAEWTDDYTLVFTPSKILDPGKVYTGELALNKLGAVKERLQQFPLRFQTIKKDFKISTGLLACSASDPSTYILNGELTSSDYVEPAEAESWLTAKLQRKKLSISWDHSANPVHKYSVTGITRSDNAEDLRLEWDGASSGIKQKGFVSVNIPAKGLFGIISVKPGSSENQQTDIVFSDLLDKDQDLNGLIYTTPASDLTMTINDNVVSVIPDNPWEGKITLNIEKSVRNSNGAYITSPLSVDLNFSEVLPSVEFAGNGVIVPSSQNLIFPFRAAGLRAVDLRIIKIFDNNLPHYLQENEINSGYSVKRFGRPVYAGRVDLAPDPSQIKKGWDLYTIDLSDYIDVEPGILYKVEITIRKSYALSACPLLEMEARYEEGLDESMDLSNEYWSDPENYYDEEGPRSYYSYGFRWNDRDDPCKEAYYSPDKAISRNILASNIGIIAKKGEDNLIHITTNDLLSALPLGEVGIEVLDFQLQQITNGTTDQDGSASLFCGRTPFLIIASKDKDRNYLKVNEGNALSLSSFDVSGTSPENGIKAFIYGERDVWRPGDSIFLSVMIRDMKSDLPPDHPVLFELINPLEQKVDNQVLKTGGRALIAVTTATSPDAVTGNYQAVFRIGGSSFSKRIRIETIKPNRLKLDLKFPEEILGGSEKKTTGNLNVKWLNGTTAKNLKTKVEYLLKPIKTEFSKYPQYIFDDPVNEFYAESVTILDEETDSNGNASVKFEPGDDLKAPGMLNAVFTIRAKETGGDESITQASWKYAPYSVFAGINLPGLQGKGRTLFTDTENEIRIVTLDEKGKAVGSEVELNIYRISYRWWWESNDDNLASFISSNRYRPVVHETLVTRGGEISYRFSIGRREWGRYLIRVTTPGGHSTGKIVLIDWPWEYGMKENAEGATLLTINADKDKYAPGDDVKLTFPSPADSRAIITLENATGVIDEIRVPTGKGSTEVTFKVKPEMAPNVYAYVNVIQPHAQTINDMPVRLYGVIPIMVEDPGTRLQPEIKTAGEVRSLKPLDIKVSEANRLGMTYTLAVVDEGLLDITGFKTPDPWSHFYAREALGVRTWDIYDYVLGAFGGTLEKAFATGGDDALADRSAGKAKRFTPVVRFLGPFSLAPGKTNSHAVSLPRYTGSVKVMVIACSDRAFGSAEKSVLVKDPLMVLVTAPRVISPGEKAALPVTVFVQKEGLGDITLKAESNELVSLISNSLSIRATGISETDAEFTFTAAEKTGVAKIKVTATGGGETAEYELELQVRNPNPAETRAEVKMLNKGEKWQKTFTPFGIEGSNSASISVSAMPSINLDKRLGYLITYPHGCSEQITSSAFPQLLLKNLIENDKKAVSQAESNIKDAINKLVTRQMSGGGIALWPGAMEPDKWVTSYAGHFMLEAEKQGYNIPSGFRQKWLSFQKKSAQEWKFDNNFIYTANEQAYRLFTLALAGQPDRGAMNRLRETKGTPSLAKWLLAAAFTTTGKPEVAEALLDMRNLTTEPGYYGYYYGSEIRDRSVILYSLVLMKKHELALPLLKEVCENFNSTGWYSTQSLAWGLYSYMKYAQTVSGDLTGPARVKLTANKTGSDLTAAGGQVNKSGIQLINGENSLLVENTGENPVYVTFSETGIPAFTDVTRAEKGISVKVDYLSTNSGPVDRKILEMGTDFLMVVKITNNTFAVVDNIALTTAVPSGWEIRNTRLFETQTGIKESVFDYRDIRDDRVNTYFRLNRAETKTFVIVLNAAYKGEYFQPAVWCEAMYNENCYARIPGEKVVITGEDN